MNSSGPKALLLGVKGQNSCSCVWGPAFLTILIKALFEDMSPPQQVDTEQCPDSRPPEPADVPPLLSPRPNLSSLLLLASLKALVPGTPHTDNLYKVSKRTATDLTPAWNAEEGKL